MKLEILITKWTLMGLLTKTTILYGTFNKRTQNSMKVKVSVIEKDYKTAYVTYRETVKNGKHKFIMINADITLFGDGEPLSLKATTVQLDRDF